MEACACPQERTAYVILRTIDAWSGVNAQIHDLVNVVEALHNCSRYHCRRTFPWRWYLIGFRVLLVRSTTIFTLEYVIEFCLGWADEAQHALLRAVGRPRVSLVDHNNLYNSRDWCAKALRIRVYIVFILGACILKAKWDVAKRIVVPVSDGESLAVLFRSTAFMDSMVLSLIEGF